MKSFIICNLTNVNVIRMIKSRRMRWAEHVKSVGEFINACNIFAGSLKKGNRFEDLGTEGTIVSNVF